MSPGPPKVDDHRYGSAGESFEDHPRTVVAQRWKHEHISRSQAAEDFRMADPAAERNSLLDSKRPHELLEPFPLRAVTDHGEPGHIASQKWSSPAQSKIASLPGNQAANKNQLKFGVGFRPAGIVGTHGAVYAGLRDKKQLCRAYAANSEHICDEASDDRCRIAISGPGKRHEPVQIPEASDPFLLVLELAESREATVNRLEAARSQRVSAPCAGSERKDLATPLTSVQGAERHRTRPQRFGAATVARPAIQRQ